VSLNGGVPILLVRKHEDSFSIVRWKTKEKNAKEKKTFEYKEKSHLN